MMFYIDLAIAVGAFFWCSKAARAMLNGNRDDENNALLWAAVSMLLLKL